MVKELRVWVCNEVCCECGGEVATVSYQDLVDSGVPYCSSGFEMCQFSGIGHELEADTIDLEIESFDIINSYDGGVCPDCGEGIPNDVRHGQACFNCGHVFVLTTLKVF
jgi:hypothetical protein